MTVLHVARCSHLQKSYKAFSSRLLSYE